MSLDVSRRRILQLAVAPALLAAREPAGPGPRPDRVAVYPGTDGKLVYVPDEQGNTIHDSSHAGYGGGGVAIPTVPVKETIWPVAGDNTANIQAAIDKVSALPLDRNGFRGAVLLRAGYYRMATPITIRASGVVLRGEGMGDTGTILVGTGTGTARGGRRSGGPPPAAVAAPRRRRGLPAVRRVVRAAGPSGRGGFGGGPATLIRIAGTPGRCQGRDQADVVDDTSRSARAASRWRPRAASSRATR